MDTPNARLTRLQQPTFIDPDHKYEYQHEELVQLLEGNGYRIDLAVGINYGGASVRRGVFDVCEVATNRGLFADVSNCYLLGYVCTPAPWRDLTGMARVAKWKIDGPHSRPRHLLGRLRASGAPTWWRRHRPGRPSPS